MSTPNGPTDTGEKETEKKGGGSLKAMNSKNNKGSAIFFFFFFFSRLSVRDAISPES